MTTRSTERRGNPGLASLAGLLVVADGVLAALGVLVWNARRDGHFTDAQAATFVLLGTSAACGAVVYLLALIALVRGAPGRGLARFASGLAWLRAAGVAIALIAVAVLIGISAIVGLQETFAGALAVLEVLTALYVAGVVKRRTGRG